jgi:hypothetical protein
MVKGISGFGGNNPIDPHIGLDRDNEIIDLTIRWPSGIIQTTSGPAINQELTIEESPSENYGSVQEFLELAGLDGQDS